VGIERNGIADPGLGTGTDKGVEMGIGTSIVVFAVGAILRFAVAITTTGFNVHTIGVILMIVGAVGFVISLVFWGSWGGFGGGGGGGSRRRVTTSGPGGTVTRTEETANF
jgi:hypothetical protein